MRHASAATAIAKVEVLKERAFINPRVDSNSALDILAAAPKPNERKNRQETEAAIKRKNRVMSQDGNQRRDTEERTTNRSQNRHKWFRLVHGLILSCSFSQVNERRLGVQVPMNCAERRERSANVLLHAGSPRERCFRIRG